MTDDVPITSKENGTGGSQISRQYTTKGLKYPPRAWSVERRSLRQMPEGERDNWEPLSSGLLYQGCNTSLWDIRHNLPLQPWTTQYREYWGFSIPVEGPRRRIPVWYRQRSSNDAISISWILVFPPHHPPAFFNPQVIERGWSYRKRTPSRMAHQGW